MLSYSALLSSKTAQTAREIKQIEVLHTVLV